MSSNTYRHSVLVIEVDDAIRATIEWLLSQRGYQVRSARTCAEARAWAQPGRLDVILRELLVDGVEGPDAALRLAVRLGAKTVFMSGLADQVLARRVLATEGVWLLPKPFSADALLRTLEEVIGA